MDRTLIANWNNTVKPEDVIYHLGDFALTTPDYTLRILQNLNGHKILIKGNHDKSKERMVELGFQEAFNKLELELSNGFKVKLSHFPYYDPTNPYSKKNPSTTWEDTGKVLLCGHVHTAWKIKNKMINVGTDQWDFTPISEDKVIETIKELY
jgi:calcineurin-like phosphoesterase family protein